MNYEPITIQRLDDFGAILREYESLKEQKYKLEKQLGLSGVDYSKIKVTTGNSQKLSEQERFTMFLQKINKKTLEYEQWLKPEKEIIVSQIARVKRQEYRKILVLRYIEKWKWSEIIQECFWFENDYETEKQNKYKDKVLYWNRQALKELEKISQKPYIKVEQLVFENNLKK